jgi:hypothetical protein
LAAGGIIAKDRKGNVKKFSFVSVSIVYLTDKNIETNQYPVLIQTLTEMKSYVKHTMDRKGGSVVFQDRRGPNPSDEIKSKRNPNGKLAA